MRSVEISAEVAEELAKFDGADFDKINGLSDEFLRNIKVGIAALAARTQHSTAGGVMLANTTSYHAIRRRSRRCWTC